MQLALRTLFKIHIYDSSIFGGSCFFLGHAVKTNGCQPFDRVVSGCPIGKEVVAEVVTYSCNKIQVVDSKLHRGSGY